MHIRYVSPAFTELLIHDRPELGLQNAPVPFGTPLAGTCHYEMCADKGPSVSCITVYTELSNLK